MNDDVFNELMSKLLKEYRHRQDKGYKDGLYRAHQLITKLASDPRKESFSRQDLSKVCQELKELREAGYWASSTMELEGVEPEPPTRDAKVMELDALPDLD